MRPANLNPSLHFQQEQPKSAPVPNPVSVLPRVHVSDTHIRDIPPRPVAAPSGKWPTLAAAAFAAAVLLGLFNGLPSWAAVQQFFEQTQGHAAVVSPRSASALSATTALSAASSSDISPCEGGNLRSTMCQIAYEGGISALFGN